MIRLTIKGREIYEAIQGLSLNQIKAIQLVGGEHIDSPEYLSDVAGFRNVGILMSGLKGSGLVEEI